MWFKNMQVYRLTGKIADFREFNALLESQSFTPCQPSEFSSQGWTSPRENSDLVHVVGGQALMCLTTEKKVLPNSAISAVVNARSVEIEEQQGFKPGRKMLKEIKEQVIEELLPRAFAARKSTLIWIDGKNDWLVIDTASHARADEVLRMLLKTGSNFPIEMLRVHQSPISAMTDWLAGDEAPRGFTIDQDAELRSTSESKSTVRYTRHNLDHEEIAGHIASGKQCVSLAMTWNDKISFVLKDSLTIKRVKPLDILTEKVEVEHAEESFDADLTLMAGELNEMLSDLVIALGGSADQEQKNAA